MVEVSEGLRLNGFWIFAIGLVAAGSQHQQSMVRISRHVFIQKTPWALGLFTFTYFGESGLLRERLLERHGGNLSSLYT